MWGFALPRYSFFWEAYPKRKGKADAIKAYKKVKASNCIAEILQAIEASKRSREWTKDGGQYIPYPASWLRGRRWDDELSGSPPSTHDVLAELYHEAKEAEAYDAG